MPPLRFGPAIPASKRPQAQALAHFSLTNKWLPIPNLKKKKSILQNFAILIPEYPKTQKFIFLKLTLWTRNTRKCYINLNKMVNVRMSLHVERSRFHTLQWKRNSVSVYSAWLHVTVENMKVLGVVQERFTANLCRRQQQNLLGYLCKIPDIFSEFDGI